MPQLNEAGKPPSQKTKAPIKAGSAAWLVPAALLVLVAIPLAVGAFRLTQLAGGAEITPANARFFASPLPAVTKPNTMTYAEAATLAIGAHTALFFLKAGNMVVSLSIRDCASLVHSASH